MAGGRGGNSAGAVGRRFTVGRTVVAPADAAPERDVGAVDIVPGRVVVELVVSVAIDKILAFD